MPAVARGRASLKFFQLEGCFPSSAKDIPSVAIDHMAKLLDVDPKTILDYDWQGRTGTRYRRRLRTAMGIRPSTAEDFKAVETWLRQEVVPWDHDSRHLQDAVHAWNQSRLIEPPTEGRIERRFVPQFACTRPKYLTKPPPNCYQAQGKRWMP